MRSTVTALVSLCAATTAQAQSTLPRPGQYYCYTTTAGTAARGPYAIAVLLAFFGKLIVDASGAYRFTGRAGGGRVTLNRTTKQLTFTGDMHAMRGRDYSSDEDSFTLGSDTFSFLCTLEGRSASAVGTLRAHRHLHQTEQQVRRCPPPRHPVRLAQPAALPTAH